MLVAWQTPTSKFQDVRAEVSAKRPRPASLWGGVMDSFSKRFWDRVNIGAPDECWKWTGETTSNGYGRYVTRYAKPNSRTGAHRIAWMLSYGEIQAGLCVCHKCDNPPCCNPAHLWIGTHRDNTLDAFKKGRRKYIVPPIMKEEDHGRAKLTRRAVMAAKKMRMAGSLWVDIASYFGVGYSTIRDAVLGNTWKSLKEERQND